MNDVTLTISPKIFNSIYLKEAYQSKERIRILFGGAGSGKSVFVAQEAVLSTIQGHNWLVCRKIQATVRRSVFNELLKSISLFKLTKYFDINSSDLIITCKTNNCQIMFTGLDDVEKIKSITPKVGVITDIWVEEATECEPNDLKQLQKRLRGQSKFKKRITMTFNPILKSHWIFETYFSNHWDDTKTIYRGDDLFILKTTYKDNKFLAEDDIRAMENESDRYYYQVYTLGNWGIVGKVIFTNWRTESFDPVDFDNWRNGIDWGFAVDPFAFVRTHYDVKHRRIYIYDEIYEVGLLNKDSAAMVKERIKDEVVYPDSAEPKSIAEYNYLTVNAQPAKKGPGSIEYGIKFLQAHEIIVHPRCVNTIKELSTYKYKEDKDGNVLPVPVDKNNHLCDALRYAYSYDFQYAELNKKKYTINDLKLEAKKGIYSEKFEEIEDALQIEWRGEDSREIEYIAETISGDSVTGY